MCDTRTPVISLSVICYIKICKSKILPPEFWESKSLNTQQDSFGRRATSLAFADEKPITLFILLTGRGRSLCCKHIDVPDYDGYPKFQRCRTHPPLIKRTNKLPPGVYAREEGISWARSAH